MLSNGQLYYGESAIYHKQTIKLRSKAHLVMYIDGGEILVLPMGGELILGRATEDNTFRIVDLTPYDYNNKAGISRLHARVVQAEDGNILIQDLDSSNGTTINGQRLMPRERHEIKDGDTICLGKLSIHVKIKENLW